jgi:hypothetical protein
VDITILDVILSAVPWAVNVSIAGRPERNPQPARRFERSTADPAAFLCTVQAEQTAYFGLAEIGFSSYSPSGLLLIQEYKFDRIVFRGRETNVCLAEGGRVHVSPQE